MGRNDGFVFRCRWRLVGWFCHNTYLINPPEKGDKLENLHFTFYGFKKSPHISIDGKTIKASRTWKKSNLSVQIPLGEHKIVVCEKRILFTWYWWILLFNLIYPLLCFRGFSGKQAGYDGECATVVFRIVCKKQNRVSIDITRYENSWNMTPLNANYNSLSLHSNIPLYIESNGLSSKKVLKLKLCMIIPFILVAIIFSCAWISLLIQKNLSCLDIIISCIIEISVLAYTTYKTYKIGTQKSFYEYSKISRITVFTKNK